MNENLLEAAHKTVKGLYNIGLVDMITMHEFDALCLPPIKQLDSSEIRKIRLHEKVSQAVLALILNVSLSTVRHWESGDKKPSGAALKLLNLISQKGIAVLT